MKRFVLSLLGLSLAISTQAQITLTNSNVRVGPYSMNGLFTAMSVPAVPLEGPNQTWNYRNAFAAGSWWANNYISSNPQFPGATWGVLEGESIPGKSYSYYAYYYHSTSNYNIIGHETQSQGYSMASVTGNSNDSLFIPAQSYTLPAPEILLEYPATYESAWRSNYQHVLNVNIKVAAAGLNKAPMQRRSAVTVTDSVVGWGTMTTLLNHTHSVFMVKRIETAVDSFYLNGGPAPASLLATLTVSQGQIRTNNTYKFYRENAMKPLAEFHFRSNNFTNSVLAVWDGSSYAPLGINAALPQNFPVQLYPNPGTGNNITLAFEKPEKGTWKLRVVDLTGREIANQTIENTGAIKQPVLLPGSLKKGLYTWQLLDVNSKVRGSGKLSIISNP